MDDRAVRATLLREHGIEIGGGLGPSQGTVWRIGLMGESATRTSVDTLLGALDEIFTRCGWSAAPGLARRAAAGAYADDEPRP